MSRDYAVQLPEGAGVAELTAAVRADVRTGRLAPGVRLPGSRTLARRLGLSRSTVVRAYAALSAEGWLEGHAGRGMVVSPAAIAAPPPPAAHAAPHRVGFALGPPPPAWHLQPPPPGCRYAMEAGTPDLRSLPLDELSRAIRRVLRGRGRSLVDYGDPAGDPTLRRVLARWLAETRGLPDRPDRLIPLRGSQMGLYLLGRLLIRPGDRVAVEDHGYRPAWGALQSAGATLTGVPVDADGLVVDQLPTDVRAVYLTPHHQYPTTALLSARRRVALLEWAHRHRVAVLEDDYDHEFHFGTRPVLPLAHLDPYGVVIHIGTLSKAFAPGLRLGWVAGPVPVVERLVALRRSVDRQGNHVIERAVAELLDDGTIPRHIRRMRRTYAQRRAHLGALIADLPLTPAPTSGGLALWCKTGPDADQWARAAVQQGVFVRSGREFRLDGARSDHLRLGFSGLDEAALTEAVQGLRRALPRSPTAQRARVPSLRTPPDRSPAGTE